MPTGDRIGLRLTIGGVGLLLGSAAGVPVGPSNGIRLRAAAGATGSRSACAWAGDYPSTRNDIGGSRRCSQHRAPSACGNPVWVAFPVVADDNWSQVRAVSLYGVEAVRWCGINRREGIRRV